MIIAPRHVNTTAFDLYDESKHKLIEKVMSFCDLSPIIVPYLTLTPAMFTFHIVAIPDVLYLLLYNPKGPVMENNLFLVLCTQIKIMKITDTALFSQIHLGHCPWN